VIGVVRMFWIHTSRDLDEVDSDLVDSRATGPTGSSGDFGGGRRMVSKRKA
jgi:hypothetical protein